MAKSRLDNMTIQDVRDLYNIMFSKLISQKVLDQIYEIYFNKYNEMIQAQKAGYTPPSGIGRGYNYLKNLLYGWYVEDLFFELIQKNDSVIKIEHTGNDKEHRFEYDKKNKTISICGTKTTFPDFLITLDSGKQIYLELKSSATEIYSVKVGNVKQLQKVMGSTGIYSMIIMVDLVNEKYEIKDLSYFLHEIPFVNQRMEGQICYDFPIPTKSFQLLKNEKFDSYIKQKMFKTEEVKKYRALEKAERMSNKEMKKKIKSKIALDELLADFEYRQKVFYEKTEKIFKDYPNIQDQTWDDILLELEK